MNLNQKCILLEQNIRKLFMVCENIKIIISKNKFINDKNIIYVYFSEFIKTYDEIGAEESMILFEEFYAKKKYQILSGQDSWIKDKATIEYPTKKRTKKRKAILLSIFYNNAVELSREAERDVTEFNREEEAANVYLPEELVYPLLEIFSIVAPEEDLPVLEKYKEEIRSELPNTNVTPLTSNPFGNFGSVISSVLGNLDMKSIQESIGSPASSSEPPKAEKLTGAIGNIFTNPKSLEVINNVIGRFNGVKDATDLQGAVANILTDKQLHENVKSLVNVPPAITNDEANEMIEESKKECEKAQQ